MIDGGTERRGVEGHAAEVGQDCGRSQCLDSSRASLEATLIGPALAGIKPGRRSVVPSPVPAQHIAARKPQRSQGGHGVQRLIAGVKTQLEYEVQPAPVLGDVAGKPFFGGEASA